MTALTNHIVQIRFLYISVNNGIINEEMSIKKSWLMDEFIRNRSQTLYRSLILLLCNRAIQDRLVSLNWEQQEFSLNLLFFAILLDKGPFCRVTDCPILNFVSPSSLVVKPGCVYTRSAFHTSFISVEEGKQQRDPNPGSELHHAIYQEIYHLFVLLLFPQAHTELWKS